MLAQRLTSTCLELVSLEFSEPVRRGKLDIVRRVNPGSRIKLRSDVSAPSLASVNKQQDPIHKRIGCVESRILIILNALRLERQRAAHDMLVALVSERRTTTGIATQCASRVVALLDAYAHILVAMTAEVEYVSVCVCHVAMALRLDSLLSTATSSLPLALSRPVTLTVMPRSYDDEKPAVYDDEATLPLAEAAP